MTFPAHNPQHPACLPPSLLVSAIVASPPHKPHCWLTNKINNPAAINRASRIPTTNEITGCRLGLTSFDPEPFCAAPVPNQKRSFSIARTSSVLGNQMPIFTIPFLYLIDLGQVAVLLASVFGLACWLLIAHTRAISLASSTQLQESARSTGPVLFINHPPQRAYLPCTYCRF